ncbi:MAG: porin family protein [Bryobacteraceae bacterium]
MKALLVAILLLPAAAYCQPVGVGLKIGAPLSDAFNIANGSTSYTADTHRYTLGPFVELRLPAHLSIEVDALYKNFEYRAFSSIGSTIFNSHTTASSWEFPVLLKYHILPGIPILKPYVEAGPTFSRLSGVRQLFTCSGDLCGLNSSGSSNQPGDLNHNSDYGLTFGAGLEVKLLLIRISPEIRYTRWGFANFASLGDVLKSNQNQAAVLVGVSF